MLLVERSIKTDDLDNQNSLFRTPVLVQIGRFFLSRINQDYLFWSSLRYIVVLDYFYSGIHMHRVSAVFLAACVTGCAGNARPLSSPSYADKPRVQINKQVPPEAVPKPQPQGN